MTVPLVLLSIAVVGFGMMPAPLMQAIPQYQRNDFLREREETL